MKLFVLMLRLPADQVRRFERLLKRFGRHIGVKFSSSTRDSSIRDTDEEPVYAFLCQAPESLTPEQITMLMGLCVEARASILSITYGDFDEDTEKELPPVAILRQEKPPSPVQLIAVNGERVDKT